MTALNRNLSKTLFLYVVKETFFAFLVCFLFFFFVFFVNQLLLMAGQILSKRVPFYQVALLVFYSLPSIIALAAPFASLTSTLMTIGRLSTDNEILVILSSGISLRDVLLPAAAVGLTISLLSFFANDILLPAGTVQFSRLYRKIAISSPGLEFETNSVKRFKNNNTLVITGAVSDGKINDIVIMDTTNDGERRLIVSNEASLRDAGKGRVSIDLAQSFVKIDKENMRNNYDYAHSPLLTYTISQEDAVQAVYTPSAREMSSVDVRKQIKRKEAVVFNNIDREKRKVLHNSLILETVLRGGRDVGEWNQVSYMQNDFEASVKSANLIKKDRSLSIDRLEYYKKFSIPCGALSFVLLAVSLGLMAKKSGQTVGFIFGIIISVLYWAFLLGGQTMGTQRGFSPFWSMWFPNFLALGAGLVLIIIRLAR